MRFCDTTEFRNKPLPDEVDIVSRWDRHGPPLLSVICITYNHRMYLEDAIRGFLLQETSFPFEIIIQDDASSDGTRQLLLDYSKKYPTLIKPVLPEKNLYSQGIKPTFNAIKFASAPLIALCEGDDYWIDSRKLQKQYSTISSSPSTTLVHSAGCLERSSGLRRIDYSEPDAFATRTSAACTLMQGNAVLTATALYRREVFDRLEGTDRLRLEWPFGDYALALQAASMGTVVKLPDETAVYRTVEGSLTNRGRASNLKFMMAAHECRKAFAALLPLEESKAKALLAQSAVDLLTSLATAGDVPGYRIALGECAAELADMGFVNRLNLAALARFWPYRIVYRVARSQIRRILRRNEGQH